MRNQPREFSRLINCWQSLPKQAGKAPQKTTFSLKDLASLMPMLFLLECRAGEGVKVRLKGAELDTCFGGVASARSSFEQLILGDWSFYECFLRRCGEGVCGGHLHRPIEIDEGLVNRVEALHVPLADKEGNACFILGVMISRPERELADPALMAPVPHIPNYSYIDLGFGVPKSVSLRKPSFKPVDHDLPRRARQDGPQVSPFQPLVN